MKPPPFRYSAPATVDEAVAALAENGADAKVLAGGQSLVPLLNMRLASPAHLVDINRLTGELGSIDANEAGVRVGALARHAEVERSAQVADVLPLLRQALIQVAHPVIRNRGTVVGSIAHADPAAELPAVLALVGGCVDALSSSGRRTVPAGELFVGPLETSLHPDELVTSAWFPALAAGTRTAFVEVARRHGDYAVCGVAVAVTRGDDGSVTRARAAYVGVSSTPVLLDLTDAVRDGEGRDDRFDAAARLASARVDPDDDIHATAEYRRHLAAVLTARALRAAA